MGPEAYSEARRRERDVNLPDGATHAGRTPAHWRKVALIVAKRTGYAVGLDTATRMLISRDVNAPMDDAALDDCKDIFHSTADSGARSWKRPNRGAVLARHASAKNF